MHAFRRSRSGYVTRMDATERAIVGRVVSDVAQLLGVSVDQGPPPAVSQPDGSGAGSGASGESGVGDLPTMGWGAVGLDPAALEAGEETDPSFDDGGAGVPDDPALARLLPPASSEPEIAAEVRRLTEESVRTAKAERLRMLWWDLRSDGSGRSKDRIVVPAERAMVWAGALTDVRLVLAQRLGVEDADDAAALDELALTSPDEVSRALATLYLALSWLQESLLEAMLDDLPPDGTD